MELKLNDRIRFMRNLPITAFDSDGVPVSISNSHVGIIVDLSDILSGGFPQVLIHTDCGSGVVGVPMETINLSADRV